jgi:hypothetical protein
MVMDRHLDIGSDKERIVYSRVKATNPDYMV